MPGVKAHQIGGDTQLAGSSRTQCGEGGHSLALADLPKRPQRALQGEAVGGGQVSEDFGILLRSGNGEVEFFFRLGQGFEPIRVHANGKARQSQAPASRQCGKAGSESGLALDQLRQRQGAEGVWRRLAGIAGCDLGCARRGRRSFRAGERTSLEASGKTLSCNLGNTAAGGSVRAAASASGLGTGSDGDSWAAGSASREVAPLLAGIQGAPELWAARASRTGEPSLKPTPRADEQSRS